MGDAAGVAEAAGAGEDPRVGGEKTPFGLYVHVPFCAARCGYCDFNTYVAEELAPGVSRGTYPARLAEEVALCPERGRRVDTVFFGGGTPTLLGPGALGEILAGLREAFAFAPGAEVTVEANPDSVTPADVEALAEAGFTRISLGMQSASPAVLATLERTHRQEHLVAAVRAAQAAGLQTSVDLIYATPGESMQEWMDSLRAVAELGVDHVSAYALVIEPGTRMGAALARGAIAAVDPDDEAAKYEAADEFLAQAGYEWYEISNWARGQEFYCRHNLGYWRGGEWVGFGPGAHSYARGVRWWNPKHPRVWAETVLRGRLPEENREVLSPEQRAVERVMLGLRTRYGLELREDELGVAREIEAEGLGRVVDAGVAAGGSAGGSAGAVAGARAGAWAGATVAGIPEASGEAWAEASGKKLVLTRAGRLMADAITLRFI